MLSFKSLRCFLQVAVAIATITVVSEKSVANVHMNSMCYLESAAEKSIRGENVQTKFELASVSKIVTSYWAVSQLGPTHRFATMAALDPVGPDLYDVHIVGSRDPVFGRDMTHLLLSELARAGVRKIRNLTFDENFYYFYQVQSRPTWSVLPTTNEIAQQLKSHLKYTPEYFTTVRIAKSIGIELFARPLISVENSFYLPASQFKSDKNTRFVSVISAPLFNQLKFMNRVSNNFIADHLFFGLGGAEKFQQFLKEKLDLKADDIKFVNGSGDSVIRQDYKNKTYKVYNESSCESLIKVIVGLRRALSRYNQDLEDVMAVSGKDQSTLGGRYSGEISSDALIAKTGSVNPAITLAGMISTEKGDVYFGIMYHTDGPSQWSYARNQIRNKILQLINKYGGKDELNYTPTKFLPFDKKSVEINSYLNKSRID